MNPQQKKSLVCIVVALTLCVVLPILVLRSDDLIRPLDYGPIAPLSFRGGVLIAMGLSFLIAQGFIAFAAFEKSMLWFLVVLIVPFGLLAFLLLHWRDAKPAFPFLALAGVMLLFSLVLL